MEQFRKIGEVLGSIKALMVFEQEIQMNQRQCCFLLEAFTLAYETIGDEMKRNLRFEERHTRWKALEHPLKELYKINREGEAYIRNCFENSKQDNNNNKDNCNWWGKAISLYQNRDCIQLHIHNLLSCIPSVIEAIESVASREYQHEWSRKYQREWNDSRLFQWKYGKQYLITKEITQRIDGVWNEDRWILLDKIRGKRIPPPPQSNNKYCNNTDQLTNLLLDDKPQLLPCSVLVGSKDYQVRRRLGSTGEYKEISWLGETFVLRHIKGNDHNSNLTIPQRLSQLLSLSHPNILQFLCGFKDEEKNEYFMITEMMSRDLGSHIKELYNPKKKIPLSLLGAIDILLQIVRGMEYLHSNKIFHGDLNPSNILLKTKSSSDGAGGGGGGGGFVHVKIAKFGGVSSATSASTSALSSPKYKNNNSSSSNEALSSSYIWHAPEVLIELSSKHTEKSDVYSFGMICFELLSGKVPFDESHLQGEKMSRNIMAGERPLFPHHCPKFMINITKKCWHSDPEQRPTFSSIARILRYIKRFLVMNNNPDYYSCPDNAPLPLPPVDYCDIESSLLKIFPSWMSTEPQPVSDIPFQMFVYRVMEKEKCMSSFRDTTNNESGSEGNSVSGDEHATNNADDPIIISVMENKNTVRHESIKERRLSIASRSVDTKASRPDEPIISVMRNKITNAVRQESMKERRFSIASGSIDTKARPGTAKGRLLLRPPQLARTSRSLRSSPENQMILEGPRKWRKSGHASDSEA